MTLPFPVPHDLFPLEHRCLELDGARIHFVDEGTGETILLLHGTPRVVPLSQDHHRAQRRVPLRRARLSPLRHVDRPAGYRFTPREHSAVLERLDTRTKRRC
jgi:haloalkane dehalogenase